MPGYLSFGIMFTLKSHVFRRLVLGKLVLFSGTDIRMLWRGNNRDIFSLPISSISLSSVTRENKIQMFKPPCNFLIILTNLSLVNFHGLFKRPGKTGE